MEAKRKQEEEERKKREDEEKRIQVCAHGAAAESLSEWNYRLMKQERRKHDPDLLGRLPPPYLRRKAASAVVTGRPWRQESELRRRWGGDAAAALKGHRVSKRPEQGPAA